MSECLAGACPVHAAPRRLENPTWVCARCRVRNAGPIAGIWCKRCEELIKRGWIPPPPVDYQMPLFGGSDA